MKIQNVLQTTKGGYPHVTLCYTGRKVEEPKLVAIGALCMQKITAGGSRKLTLNNVMVNKFFEEKTGKDRYDVLIELDQASIQQINELREWAIPQDAVDKAIMRPPHVTHSIHYDAQSAEQTAAALQTSIPAIVFITGFTID